MQLEPVVGSYLDKRWPFAEHGGKFKVRLRVTFKVLRAGKVAYQQPLYDHRKDFFLTPEEWDKVNDKKARGEWRRIREALDDSEGEAREIIKPNPFISPKLFGKMWSNEYVPGSNLEVLFKEAELGARSVSTGTLYADAYKSLVSFGGVGLQLEMITVDWLKRYEQWMLESGDRSNKKKKGNKYTTIGIYLRNLRAIFNVAISRGLVPWATYPFGKGKYQIPSGEGIKKALEVSEKNTVVSLQPENEDQLFKVSMWIFSYYAKGMNPADIAHLEPENIHGDVLIYFRRKTFNTAKVKKPIMVPITPQMKEVLERYGKSRPYIFGIIKAHQTPKERRRAITDFISATNKILTRLSQAAGVNRKVRFNDARHTAATLLLNAGVNLKYIQDSLGHTRITTTEHYTKGLGIEESRKITESVL
jgi:integrase/recombinase XerD